MMGKRPEPIYQELALHQKPEQSLLLYHHHFVITEQLLQSSVNAIELNRLITYYIKQHCQILIRFFLIQSLTDSLTHKLTKPFI